MKNQEDSNENLTSIIQTQGNLIKRLTKEMKGFEDKFQRLESSKKKIKSVETGINGVANILRS